MGFSLPQNGSANPDQPVYGQENLQTLIQDERVFEGILENLLASFGMCDEQLRIFYWNRQLEAVTGCSPAELDGLSALAFFEGAEGQRAEQALRRAFSEGQAELDVTATLKDGRQRRTHLKAARVHAAGKLSLIVMAEDISERWQMQALLDIQRDLLAVLGSTSDLRVALDAVLEAACRIDGIDCGAMYLVDAQTQAVRLEAQRGLHAQMVEEVRAFPADFPGAELPRVGQAQYITFVASPDLSGSTALSAEGLRALAFLPVMFEERLVAMLNVASRSLNSIPGSTRAALEAIAAQIGGTLARIHAQQALREREAALRESELNLQALFDGIDDLLFVLDASGRILQTNLVVQTRLHYTPEELQQMTIMQLAPAEQPPEMTGSLAEMLADDLGMCAMTLQTRLGASIPVETRFSHGRFGGQAVLFGIARDVSTRHRAEQQLHDSLQRQVLLVEQSPLAVIEWDTDFRVLSWNPAAERIFGYTRAEALGKRGDELIVPDEAREQVELSRRSLLELHGGTRDTYRNITKDGRRIICDWYNTPLVGEYGRVVGAASLCVDITRRRQAENALRESNETLQAIFHVSPLPIVLMNQQQQVQMWNPAAERTFGWTRQEVIGKPNPLLPQEQQAEYCAIDEKITRDGRITDFETIRHRKDGSPVHVSLSSALLYDSHGSPRARMAILADITGRKQAEYELKESEMRVQALNDELLLAYDATIEGWARALELRDRETTGHSRRVVDLTVQLASRLDVNEADLVHMRRGALLHDIGKMGVPDGILLKPGQLNADEWRIMRMHPANGYELLKGIPYLCDAVEIPYCHHEWWNGKGYPRGLKGEHIPLSARIFAVVDVWDALTNERPYRLAWAREEVARYLRAGAGRQFDPHVVETFLEIVRC